MTVIAITGGGAGIGRGIAWHFARAGHAVSITDCDRQAGRESPAQDDPPGCSSMQNTSGCPHPGEFPVRL